MSTIAKMLVEMAGDPSGLRRAFRESVQDAKDYGRDMRAAVNNTGPVLGGTWASQAKDAAKGMVSTFKKQYDMDMAVAREQLARGIISPEKFRQAGELAATSFNRELLNGISKLRDQQMLPPGVHAKLVKELKDAGMEAGKEARLALQAQLKTIGDDMASVGRGLKSAGQTLTYSVTLPVLAFGAAASKMAADANESFNKFDVLFGKMSGNVSAQLAKMHNTIPATTAQLKDMASNFQALLVPMGFTAQQAAIMSTRLTLLGGDITSLHNIPVGETMQRLFSGLVGETESVRRFGVDISEARLRVLAHTAGLGDNVQALTRAQKTQLIYNEILRATSVVNGDAAATAGSAANQMRFLARDAHEASIVFGQRLLPTLVPLMQSLSRVLEGVTKLSPATLDMIIKFALAAAAIGPVLTAVGSLIGAFASATLAASALAGASAAAAGGAEVGGLAGVALALTGPVGIAVALGVGAAALIAWIAYSRQAKVDVDALAASFRGMSEAQLAARMQSESGRMLDLQRERDRILGAGVTGGSSGQQDAADMANLSRLNGINRRIEEQQALLNGLGTAWNQLAVARAAATAQDEVNNRRNQAMLDALKLGMGENAGAAKAAKKELDEYIRGLGSSTSAISDLYAEAVKFHRSTGQIESMAVQAFRAVNAAIDAQGGKFDANTAKLMNMRVELEKIRAVSLSPWGMGLPAIGLTHSNVVGIPNAQQSMAEMNQRRLVNGGDFWGITPNQMPESVQQAPPILNDSVLRQRIAFEELTAATKNVGGKLREMLAPIGTALGQLINPLKFFGGVMTEIANALQPVFEPLRPILADLAAVIAQAIAPVLRALAPVIKELIPLFSAVAQVIAPILTALVPLLRAMVPILNALFPVFKMVAIAATYIGQAFGNAASIVLRAVGNIVIGFGTIIYQLARAIDALPFVSAGHAMDVAQGIIDWGRALVSSSDEFKQMANDMVTARNQIKEINLNGAADGAQKLADATNAAAEAMLSVPAMFRFRTRLVEQWNERELTHGGEGTTSTPASPAPSGPTDATPSIPNAGGGESFIIHGDVNINTGGGGVETFEAMRVEARRRALATSGQTSRASEEFS